MKTVLTAVVAMASIAAVAELPPHLIEAITNAAAVTEAKTYTNAAGASLNYRVGVFFAPDSGMIHVRRGPDPGLRIYIH